jgi:cytochrome b561
LVQAAALTSLPDAWTRQRGGARDTLLLCGWLIVMIVAGFGTRWVRSHGVEFLGLSTPSPVTLDPAWRPGFNGVHNWGAWAFITLAGLHAAAAPFHYFALQDGVLRRMLPGPAPVGSR